MENSEYQLSYLPLFQKDLTDVVHYIADELNNPSAANRLVVRLKKLFLRDYSTHFYFNLFRLIVFVNILTTEFVLRTSLFTMWLLDKRWKFADYYIEEETLILYYNKRQKRILPL